MPRWNGGLVKIAHPYGMDVAQTETRSRGFLIVCPDRPAVMPQR
jgi:hypothetical protein